jgi:hypothetical protein
MGAGLEKPRYTSDIFSLGVSELIGELMIKEDSYYDRRRYIWFLHFATTKLRVVPMT